VTEIVANIVNQGRPVPIVAFMGTKGGTGKTTVARTFIELVAQGVSRPNVLLIDSDVHHRGMTIEIEKNTPVTCKSLHDYISSNGKDAVEPAYMSGEIRDAFGTPGDLYFIPASYPDSDEVFHRSARIGADEMLRIIHSVITEAVKKCDCRCVVIDCGAIVDPYTAAAVRLADRAFIVATNDDISFQNLGSYPRSIRGFYPDFNTAKMKTIFNRVRSHDMLEQRKMSSQQNIYASIPFQSAVMDGVEGVGEAERLARIFLRKHVGDIVKRIFSGDHQELIPDSKAMVPPDWFPVLQNADGILNGSQMKRKGASVALQLFLGVVMLALSVGFLGWTTWERYGTERMRNAQALALALKGEIASTNDTARKDRLQEALRLAEAVSPHDPDSLKEATTAASKAGMGDLPQGARLSRTKENLTVLAVIVMGIIVVSGYAKRRQHIFLRQLLQRIMRDRSGGVSVLGELENSRDARRGFSILKGMVE